MLPTINVSAKRTFKSTMFETLFSSKKELLELYNAMNHTNYTDPELLEINTLENAIYMSMRNDVSFIIDSRLSLYEHQSTVNPNLPLRFLLYVSDLYSVITKDANLYSTRITQIPTPNFVVFYNGTEDLPESMELRLLDAFSIQSHAPAFELKATLLNINPGHNPDLLSACKTLSDYSEYTNRVRKYAANHSLDEAVERTITECIQEGILADFLNQNRMEAKHMSIYEYDYEKHMQMERAEAREDGIEIGKKQLLQQKVQKKFSKGKSIDEIAEALEETSDTILAILKELNLSLNTDF